MRFGSVCSGIEAASCAWEPLGWKARWFSEIAPFPSSVLAHRFPKTPNHGSLVGLAARLVGPHRDIDVLVGGTPCQSFSVAGLRGGLADERGNLALEFARLAQAIRPRWVLWENVPGVLSSNGGRDFGAIVGALVELGYGVAYRVLDARHFGVPQRRRRVFLVGSLAGWAAAAAVLFEPESVRGNSATRGAARQEVAGTLGGGSGKRGWAPDTDRMTFIPERERWPKDVAPTLNAAFGEKLGLEDQHALGGAGLFVPDCVGTLTRKGPAANGAPEVDAGHYLPIVMSSGQANANVTAKSARPPHIAFSVYPGKPPNAELHAREIDEAPALTATAEAKATDRGVRVVESPPPTWRVRRLTPIECERLQGFPDGWTDVPGASDGGRYAALGNSMAVPVMRWIGERIQLVDGLLGGAR